MKGRILVIDDEKLIRWSLEKDLRREGYDVFSADSAISGMKQFGEQEVDVVLLDIRLPDGDGQQMLLQMKQTDPLISVIMVTANDDVRTAVQCMQAGAFTYLHKPFEWEELKLNVVKALEGRRLKQKIRQWETRQKIKYDFGNIVAHSEAMKQVLGFINKIIETEVSTVLIQGESGVGKDLLARTIHYSGRHADKPFVSLNCAAIPATLLESELFGHEKGSFTDAKQNKKGLVEEAAGGTLFLDEIGDMSKELQAKLLHLIDRKQFRKVGGVKEIEAEIRIIAATNKLLKKEVEEKNFREDLYYRLNVLPIQLPPLRQRSDDILPLCQHFINHFNKEFKKNVQSLASEAQEIILSYPWPGNVRELKNVIERAMILNNGEIIGAQDLPSELECNCTLKEITRSGTVSVAAPYKIPHCLVGMPLDMIEKEILTMTLFQTKGNQSQAARLLGIGRDALRYKMQKFNLMPIGNGADEDEDKTKFVSEITQPRNNPA